MSDRTPEELAYRWRDALNGRDPGAFVELFAGNGVMVDVEHRTLDLGRARPLLGREEIGRTCRAWLEETPAFEYDVLEVLSDTTSATVRWRYAVEGLEIEGVSWLRCEDGVIREALVLFDSLGLFRALGRV